MRPLGAARPPRQALQQSTGHVHDSPCARSAAPASQVSPLCLGGNVFGWTVDEATSLRLLDAWVDAGMNFVDTADVYSRWVPGHVGGESETIIGKWLAHSGKRDRVVLATKVGMQMGDDEKGLSRAYIRAPSRRRCGACRPTASTSTSRTTTTPQTPLEETLSAFAELIKAGKVRAIGASNYTRAAPGRGARDEQARSACRATSRCSRSTTSSTARAYEDELEPVVRRATASASSTSTRLARGFLTGKYRSDGRPRQERARRAAPAST